MQCIRKTSVEMTVEMTFDCLLPQNAVVLELQNCR